ncbi:uncharacterized protein K460DRAFT_370225 [Cucurbitaria berberidis CBS 394.84]|uniref:F-box domain-containing protein n=1 Tax=Cucurbitaria berberidis CBS 394.84 TaxID=1168544 RepID=A0A9P4GAZ2_9PLEO|nr:uncharacterized protein K460DRAFT_370225 [Cucurbitaria berberidis CBS 394.84]KAF1842236.1 hypothetical protein K460DRAFT_370225 [Cucurbitaria berberidis CBS 394.84]
MLNLELRNQVYSYLLEDLQTSLNVIDYYEVTTSKRDRLLNFLALTRVSRQIRGELLPLLVESQVIRVHLRHVPAFSNSILCHHIFDLGISIEIPLKIDIILDMFPNSVTKMDADMASLLRLVVTRPKLHLAFTTTLRGRWRDKKIPGASENRVQELNRIFSLEHRDAWKSALDSSIARVELSEVSEGEFLGEFDLCLREGSEVPPLHDLGFRVQSLDAEGRVPRGNGPFLDRNWIRVVI